MKILCKEQRTEEWFKVKRGVISASEAKTTLMGKGTKGRNLYIAKLADDLEGLPDFDQQDNQPWFIDGVYYESWACGWYSFKHDIDVTHIGFAVHDDNSWIGCSPDGLVGDEGLVEFKYRKTLHTFTEHTERKIPTAINAQVQTQMYVCDRAWCDYVNYWRSDDHELEKGHVQRIYRDQAYIDNTLLMAFKSLWSDVQKEVRRRELQSKRLAG